MLTKVIRLSIYSFEFLKIEARNIVGDFPMLTSRFYFVLVSVVLCATIVGCATTGQSYGLNYLKTAAAQGDVDSQRLLGIKYYKGSEVAQDYKEAAKWFRLSAEQGDTVAQTSLGKMYYDGKGVKQDRVYAHMWWNIAAFLGNKTSVKARNKFSKSMTQSQLKEAQQLARACAQKNYKGC